MINSLKALNINSLIVETLEENSPQMVQANQLQLLASQNALGKSITPEYSPNNQKKKGFKNPNLFDTGAFQKAIKTTVRGSEIEFTSTDFKTPKLTTKYGEEIFGLTVESKNDLKPINQMVLVSNAKKALGL